MKLTRRTLFRVLAAMPFAARLAPKVELIDPTNLTAEFIEYLKPTTIITISNELMRASSVDIEAHLRQALMNALADGMDDDYQ